MPTTEINGVRLYWECSGDAGEPLVLVHGSWVDHHSWDRVAPALAETFQVLTYDRRGHSQSERPTAQGSVYEDVDDLAALIKELGFDSAHIAGSSFGGSIVLRLAMEHPDLCRSIIVNEPPLMSLLADEPGGQAMLQAINERFSAVEKLLASGDMAGGARQFVETIVFGPGSWEHLPPALRETVSYNAPTFLDELHDPDAYRIDLDPLKDFTCPALLTYGEQSPDFLHLTAQKVAGVMPQAELMMFPGATHEPEQSTPEAYVEAVMDFIKRAAVATP